MENLVVTRFLYIFYGVYYPCFDLLCEPSSGELPLQAHTVHSFYIFPLRLCLSILRFHVFNGDMHLMHHSYLIQVLISNSVALFPIYGLISKHFQAIALENYIFYALTFQSGQALRDIPKWEDIQSGMERV